MKQLRYFVFLDDGTYAELGVPGQDSVKLVVAQDTDELQDFIDNDPNLKRIDEECPRTVYADVPIHQLWRTFLLQHPEAIDTLWEEPEESAPLTDDEIMAQYEGYPPKE